MGRFWDYCSDFFFHQGWSDGPVKPIHKNLQVVMHLELFIYMFISNFLSFFWNITRRRQRAPETGHSLTLVSGWERKSLISSKSSLWNHNCPRLTSAHMHDCSLLLHIPSNVITFLPPLTIDYGHFNVWSPAVEMAHTPHGSDGAEAAISCSSTRVMGRGK